MKYKLIRVEDEVVHAMSGRHALVKVKHDHPLELIDVLWLDLHTVEERLKPAEFDIARHRTYIPK